MAQISQNADGTYSKSYSDTEIAIINILQDEISSRVAGDQQVWLEVTTFNNRLTEMEDSQMNLADLQDGITNALLQLGNHEGRIDYLEKSHIVDAYSKVQMDSYLSEWKVEQIPHVFDVPTNLMFDRANLDDILHGYAHYKHADIHETHDHHFPENTMRRYTISAYASVPKKATFRIQYADRVVVIADGVTVATYIDAGGNFGGTPKLLVIDLKEGWTRIQFLVANETQQGGLVVESDLYEQADYLANLDYLSGMITGDRIQAGTLDERHFSPNMDLIVHTLHATASDIPGVIVGDPNGCGILQIGDKTITKCKDEPFVFDDGIRVNGYIRVSQLLIDVDFIRAGRGIIVDAIKDAETGFTKMYEIINDLRINNGGGLIIIGNGQEGYTITNDMKLMGNPEGGILVEGNPVEGYIISNIMKLMANGGIEITGDATKGYYVKNIMRLTVSPGLKVEGNAHRIEGYHLKNQMKITGNGLIMTPTIVDVDAYEAWHIENDTIIDQLNGVRVTEIGPEAGHFEIANTMKITGERIIVQADGNSHDGFRGYNLINDTIIEEDCGIDVRKISNGHFRITNTLQIKQYNSTGSVRVTGDVCSGYTIEGLWPELIARDGIDIRDNRIGRYEITNTGVLSLRAGTGIRVSQDTGHVTVTNNGVVAIVGQGGVEVSGSPGGTWVISAPMPEMGGFDEQPFMFGVPQVPAALGGNVSVGTNGVRAQFPGTTSSGSGDTNRISYIAGVMPSAASAIVFAVQGAVDSPGSIARITIDLEVMASDGSGNIRRSHTYTSTELIDGHSGNYNLNLVKIAIPQSPHWRHWDARIYLSSGNGGKVYGKIRECWSDKAGNSKVAHHNEFPVINA